MSFNVNLPLGRSNAMSGLTGLRLTSKDPKEVTAVVYDLSDRPITVTYTLVDDTSETITLSYTTEGFLKYSNIEYRDYQYDLFAASIIPSSPLLSTTYQLQEQQREDEQLDFLQDIRDELKKFNMYMALITNTRL